MAADREAYAEKSDDAEGRPMPREEAMADVWEPGKWEGSFRE